MGKKRRRKRKSTEGSTNQNERTAVPVPVTGDNNPTLNNGSSAIQKPPDVNDTKTKRAKVAAPVAATADSQSSADRQPEPNASDSDSNKTIGNAPSSSIVATAEKERVANQRKLQKLVLNMIKKGKSQKEIRKAKIEFKRNVSRLKWLSATGGENQGVTKPKKLTKRQKHVEEWKARNLTDAQKKGQKHNIVIVPVMWRQRQAENEDIMAACATIKKYLSSFGLDVWIDARTKYVRDKELCLF